MKSERPQLLWIEDNEAFARLLGEEFERHFSLEICPSFERIRAMSPSRLRNYDAVLLDLTLSDGVFGEEAFDHIRGLGADMPVLVLSNDNSLPARKTFLAKGADDYICKSMPAEEMLLRISNAVDRYRRPKTRRLTSRRGLDLCPLTMTARLGRESIELSRLEFSALSSLLSGARPEMPLETFKGEVWRQNVVSDGAVNTLLWQLNRKLDSWDQRLAKDGGKVVLRARARPDLA